MVMSWHKQAHDQPLFPDLLWSRPERRDQAGKLLIIGGNEHGFSAPAEAFATTTQAGVGISRVLLPSKLKSTVSVLFPEAEYAPSTPSGSFARTGLAEWIETAAWADGVLIAGDLGHNSETALLLETFLSKYAEKLTITQDAAEYILSNPAQTINRPDTTLVISMGQLRKLAKHIHSPQAVTQAMGLPELTEWLSDFTVEHAVHLVTKHLDHLIVAVNGRVSTTPTNASTEAWRVATAARAAVWWLQHPGKPFEAITTSIHN